MRRCRYDPATQLCHLTATVQRFNASHLPHLPQDLVDLHRRASALWLELQQQQQQWMAGICTLMTQQRTRRSISKRKWYSPQACCGYSPKFH